jgi:hypothetical protein
VADDSEAGEREPPEEEGRPAPSDEGQEDYSEEDEAIVTKRLEDLGYL